MYNLCSRRQFLYWKGKLGPAHGWGAGQKGAGIPTTYTPQKQILALTLLHIQNCVWVVGLI